MGQPFCSQQLPQLPPPRTDAAHRLKSRWDSRCSRLPWVSKPSQRQFIIPLVFLGIVGSVALVPMPRISAFVSRPLLNEHLLPMKPRGL